MHNEHVSGFITLIGRPNVGKSTLTNQLIGEKISIISDKIQTTRHTIHGIIDDDTSQIVLVDTPGIHKPRHRLGKFMVDQSLQTLEGVDLVLFIINATEGYGKGDEYILEQLRKVDAPVFLVINKVDLIEPDDIFPLIEQYNKHCSFAETVPVSALNGNNVARLLELIREQLPKGPKYYEPNQLTDKSEKFMIAERIREKVLHHTKEEVPHSINVLIDTMEKRRNNQQYIRATIIVERTSQRGILIGKSGSMLKQIGTEARKDIEQMLGERAYLDLWVKVEKDWRNRQRLLHQYGYSST